MQCTIKGAAANGRNNSKKTGGKREGQKYKSLLVWDILQKRTDENHAISLKEIVEHLKMYGITAERHSIKRDIDDILMLLNKDMDIDLDEYDIEDRALLPSLIGGIVMKKAGGNILVKHLTSASPIRSCV